jgi:hypothetical protein
VARSLHCGAAMNAWMMVGIAALGAFHLAGCAADDSCDPDVSDCSGLAPADDGKADGDGTGIAALAQMNDLTIVLPLANSQAELDNGDLAAATLGPKGALLPEALYLAQFPDPTNTGNVGQDVGMVYDNLRLVALRFDPCFAHLGPITDPSTCDNQLRLVFQSLTYDPKRGTTAVDGAVHAFYRLTRAQLTDAIREVIALRRAQGQTTAMGPLAPHPLLVKQGLDGAFGQGLNDIVQKYASAANLIRFTHFQSGNLQTTWSFAGFDVATSGSTAKSTAMVVPTLPNKATGVEFFEGFAAQLAGGFTPETTSADDIALLVNFTNAQAATAKARKAAYDAALRIENPDFHNPNTIDCASCHMAQNARTLIGEDQLKLSSSGDANVFVADPKFVSARSMKATTTVKGQTSGLNVHMLSYKNDALMIGQRVINETAANLAYVNGVVLR